MPAPPLRPVVSRSKNTNGGHAAASCRAGEQRAASPAPSQPIRQQSPTALTAVAMRRRDSGARRRSTDRPRDRATSPPSDGGDAASRRLGRLPRLMRSVRACRRRRDGCGRPAIATTRCSRGRRIHRDRLPLRRSVSRPSSRSRIAQRRRLRQRAGVADRADAAGTAVLARALGDQPRVSRRAARRACRTAAR